MRVCTTGELPGPVAATAIRALDRRLRAVLARPQDDLPLDRVLERVSCDVRDDLLDDVALAERHHRLRAVDAELHSLRRHARAGDLVQQAAQLDRLEVEVL